MSASDECLRAWRDAIGAEHVFAAPEPTSLATFAHTHRVPALLRPGSTEEVRACVRVAARHGAPLHAVSRGRNWGLGSRLPHRDGVSVMELSRMDRVRALDLEMGAATVEPGVTFDALHARLASEGAPWFVAATGASPRASVLGNALDRGDGVGPYADRASSVCGLEAVLADGALVRTGFARFGEGPLAALHGWGVGPALDGLFSQSALGVVTAGTVWLTPSPTSMQSLRFEVRDDARLPGLVDALRALRLEGTLRGSVGLWRDARVLSTLAPHPRAGERDAWALSDEATRAMCAEHGIARWSGVAPMYAASEAQGRADRERAAEVLAPVVDAWHCEERVGPSRAGRELLTPRDPVMGLFQGIPTEFTLRSTYWRKGPAPAADLDPDRDGCGVIWAVPAVPFRGEAVLRAATEAERVLRAYGFDPLIAMTLPTPRVAQLVPLIVYDRDDPAQDARARDCHRALRERMDAHGFLPARLGVLDAMPAAADDSDALLARLRAALDPEGLLSPGRYDPAR